METTSSCSDDVIIEYAFERRGLDALRIIVFDIYPFRVIAVVAESCFDLYIASQKEN